MFHFCGAKVSNILCIGAIMARFFAEMLQVLYVFVQFLVERMMA
jgi:hypothetical protein